MSHAPEVLLRGGSWPTALATGLVGVITDTVMWHRISCTAHRPTLPALGGWAGATEFLEKILGFLGDEQILDREDSVRKGPGREECHVPKRKGRVGGAVAYPGHIRPSLHTLGLGKVILV